MSPIPTATSFAMLLAQSEMGDSVSSFIVRHGVQFKDPLTVQHGRYALMKQCFRNAMLTALENPNLTYVEGYSLAIIPVHHAWLIDKAGNVIETTWEEPGTDYFGVPIKTKFVMQAVRRSAMYSVFWNRRAGILEADPGLWQVPHLPLTKQAT